ncbi:integration host factor DNA-binding subunit alpha [Gluconobacter kanchanaburiensis NBRC 103587]|nr:integration host factor DNA-binding subunit alpha [Gluconobacter kanchanaburiensis NBRC 103587]
MILESLLGVISDRLEAGESVKLSGFGTFSVRQKGERIGRNPKTGVEVPILPRAVLVFRPSQLLRDRMNGSGADAGAEATSHDR